MIDKPESWYLGRERRGRKRAIRLFGEVAFAIAMHPEADHEEVTDELVDEIRRRTGFGVQGFRAWTLNQPHERQNAIIRLISGRWVSDALPALESL
jgi:hypothetical protein